MLQVHDIRGSVTLDSCCTFMQAFSAIHHDVLRLLTSYCHQLMSEDSVANCHQLMSEDSVATVMMCLKAWVQSILSACKQGETASSSVFCRRHVLRLAHFTHTNGEPAAVAFFFFAVLAPVCVCSNGASHYGKLGTTNMCPIC